MRSSDAKWLREATVQVGGLSTRWKQKIGSGVARRRGEAMVKWGASVGTRCEVLLKTGDKISAVRMH